MLIINNNTGQKRWLSSKELLLVWFYPRPLAIESQDIGHASNFWHGTAN